MFVNLIVLWTMNKFNSLSPKLAHIERCSFRTCAMLDFCETNEEQLYALVSELQGDENMSIWYFHVFSLLLATQKNYD